jgi:hypothetical protein
MCHPARPPVAEHRVDGQRDCQRDEAQGDDAGRGAKCAARIGRTGCAAHIGHAASVRDVPGAVNPRWLASWTIASGAGWLPEPPNGAASSVARRLS